MFIGILAFGTALLATTFYFGKIAESAAYSSIDGQVGAAASVLNALRGAWIVTPAVGVDKNQNMVHRVVGRPGIILVGEGSRPGLLVIEQRKAHARYAQGVPIHEIIVGENDVTISNLQKTVKKLGKSLRPAEDATPMNDIMTSITDALAQIPLSYGLGAILVIVFLAKKLIKWAIIFAILMFFVLPYLDEQGYLDSIKSMLN